MIEQRWKNDETNRTKKNKVVIIVLVNNHSNTAHW